VANWATIEGRMNYTRLFSVPMWGALACLLILLLFYPRVSPRRGAGVRVMAGDAENGAKQGRVES
jgi:hypothetical protein